MSGTAVMGMDDLDALLSDLTMDLTPPQPRAAQAQTDYQASPQPTYQDPYSQQPQQPEYGFAQQNTSPVFTGAPRTGSIAPATGIRPMATGVATGVPFTGAPRTGSIAPATGIRPMATGVATGIGRGGFVAGGPVTGVNRTGTGQFSPPPGGAFTGVNNLMPASQPAGRGGGGVQGVATHNPAGQALKFNSVDCAQCREPIVGKVTNALGKNWHPEHFVCTNCSQPFTDGAYIEKDGNPYCEDHFYELFAPRCASCNEPIKINCIKAIDKTWHPEHLNCQGCGKSLVGKQVKEAQGLPYCKECKEALKITIDAKIHTCGMCKMPIIGEYIFMNNMYIHPEHYCCAMCGKKLRNGDCHDWMGKNYCKEDYDKLNRQVCAGCDKPITGRSISAMGRVWHPEHFCCAYCHEPFGGAPFFEQNGLPYCEEHFKQLFGKLCAKCSKPVIRDGIEAMGKIFHQECFMCQSCDTVLKINGFVSWQSKPLCKKCYVKLPTDVRKQLEEKAAGEARMEKKRQEDARKQGKIREKEAKKKMKEAKKAK